MEIEKLKKNKTIAELLEFGIIVFDKPADCTSFDVSDFVRKKLKLRKTSHFGTLDPMVTGVLPIALNRAVKLTGFFLGEDKEYIGEMRIHEDIFIEEIKKIINRKFLGKIKQIPPVRSSVKREEREREIKKFELLKKEGKEISFLVECQGGTYVRKLVHDLGEEMKIGAHMIELKRIRAGIFTEKQMTSKEEFQKAVDEYFKGNEKLLRKIIIPAEIVSEVYPIVEVKKEFIDMIRHGAPIYHKFLTKKLNWEKGKKFCLFEGEKFIGMFRVINEGDYFARSEFTYQEMKG